MRKQLRKLAHRARGIRKRFTPVPPWPPYPSVSLTQWRSGKNVPNFGDDLSSVIVSLMLAKMGRTLLDEAVEPRELLAIGSIIHLAKQNAVLWGSGVNGKIPEHFHTYRSLDVRAVRGPYTREWLWEKKRIEAPEIYGDPALLLPVLAGDRLKPEPVVEHIFVPNLNDMLNGVVFDLPPDTTVVSPMQSWHRVVEKIIQARFVSATSLHGVIVAEAFGIPARYVRLTETENIFKYNDYYSGTGRDSVEFARSVHEAVEMGGVQEISTSFNRLYDAFPTDLWI